MRRAVGAARRLARETGGRVFLVGGAVRDLMLSRPVRDVDLLVEGDAPAFSRELANRLGAECELHERFGTATLNLPGGSRVDVAGARRETYPHPGALPSVASGASAREDLARRDFTVNALALELSPGRRLLDPFGGAADAAARRIRFLHGGSPRDDPTRAFRAVRYAARLGFRLAPETRRAIREAVEAGAVDRVSGDRLRRELRLILEESPRARSVAALNGLGLDRAVEPGLARAFPGAPGRLRVAVSAARGVSGTSWLCYLLAWMAQAPLRDLRRVAGRLALAGAERERFLAWPRDRKRLRGIAGPRPSRRRARLEGLSPDTIVAAAAIAGPVDGRVLKRHARRPDAPALSIRGSDLVAAGVPPGPAIGAALRAARSAREDGRLGAESELAYALRAARGRRSRRR